MLDVWGKRGALLRLAVDGGRVGCPRDGDTDVEACLAAIRAGDHWHNHLVRLTGHWIARGWSDAEILIAAEALTLPGYTVDQTHREVARMIEGGRAKWNIPNPEHQVADPADVLQPLAPDFLEQLNVSMLPRRRPSIGRSTTASATPSPTAP